MRRRRFTMRSGHARIVVAFWVLVTCVSIHAQDSKPTSKDSPTDPGQNSVADAKDGKTKVGNEGDRALCAMKSDDPGMATKTGELTATKESDDENRISETSNKAAAGENLSLQSSHGEWGKEQIDLGKETNSREESRSDKDKSDTSAGSDLKCTPHEGIPSTERALPN